MSPPGILGLKHIDANVLLDLYVHLVVDNHARVPGCLASRPCYHLHFTPTCASWLNQVEIGFRIITQKAIRHGSFASLAPLKEKIRCFIDPYNPGVRPFLWTSTDDFILHKIQRLCMTTSGMQH